MLVKRKCSYRQGEADACCSLALPCTQHCIRHIMYNVDQLLFEHCTAKFSDNTQCCVPVFDICHELPLCLEHARKRVSQNLFMNLKSVGKNLTCRSLPQWAGCFNFFDSQKWKCLLNVLLNSAVIAKVMYIGGDI